METIIKASDEAQDSHRANLTGNVADNPETPISHSVKIQSSNSWSPFSLKEIWLYRELLYFLVWRDVKVRYKQTVIGVAWALLQPVITMAIFSLLFGRFAGIGSDNIPYPVFAFAGLLPWAFINTAINNGSNSLINNTNLITKVYFPRLLVPVAAVFSALIDLLLGLIILVGIMFYYQVGFHLGIFLAPFFLLLMLLLTTGIGILLSSLNVRFRDVKQILPFLLQIWMFLSPIFYPSTLLPEKWRWTLTLNPLTGILESFRACLFGKPFDFLAIAFSIVFTIILFIVGILVFQRMEDDFADYV